MSTRCDIVIKDYWMQGGVKYKKNLLLYHHYDGYPEGVGKYLMEKIYPLLIKSNNIDCDIVANKLIKDKEDNEYEITVYTHTDIEYRYVIEIPMKKIFCYACHYSWKGDSRKFVKDKEIDLTPFLPQTMKKSYA